MENKQIEATKTNVELAINNIKEYATSKGFQIQGEFRQDVLNNLHFDSKSLEKVCKKYLWRLDQKIGMSLANRFLHFLYKKIYKLDKAPRIEYSERELKIQQARKAWKKLQVEAEKLQAIYKEEKGDFYKK